MSLKDQAKVSRQPGKTWGGWVGLAIMLLVLLVMGVRLLARAAYPADVEKNAEAYENLVRLTLARCGGGPTPDVEETVQAGVVATLTAQPTKPPTVTARATIPPTPTATATQAPTPTPTAEPYPGYGAPSEMATPLPAALSLQTYDGPGFSFQYPSNAQVETVEPEVAAASELHVTGPVVWVKPGDADWPYNGEAYELIVRTFENPERLDAESWAREYVLERWEEAREENRPTGSLPVTEEGTIREDWVGQYEVAGERAFWVRYFWFDSTYWAFYLTVEDRVVELSFVDYPLPNQPLAVVQVDIYALILDTFQFD